MNYEYDPYETDLRDEWGGEPVDPDYEPGICRDCGGSGEGRYEGSNCSVCNGKGEV